MRTIIGIDPGVNGGLVRLHGGSIESPQAVTMPGSMEELYELLRGWSVNNPVAYLEQVQGYIGKARPGSYMFTFGENYGAVRMALVSLKIPVTRVSPKTWQTALDIPPRRKVGRKVVESNTQFKTRLKDIAQMKFPRVRVTKATSDALLIAYYGLTSIKR